MASGGESPGTVPVSRTIYEDNIASILSCPPLLSAVQSLVGGRQSVLNLVALDWRDVLQRSVLRQELARDRLRFSVGKDNDKKINTKTIVSGANSCMMVVYGRWTLNELERQGTTTLVCRMCPPLLEIGKNMQEPHGEREFKDNCRFFVDRCLGGLCSDCKELKSQMRPTVRRMNEWCIRNVTMFDGREVTKKLQMQVVRELKNQDFDAVLCLTVKRKITYGNSYKISGDAHGIVIYKETSMRDVLSAQELQSLSSYVQTAKDDDEDDVEDDDSTHDAEERPPKTARLE